MTDAVVVPTDMRNPDEIRLLVDTAVERHGRVDILVNDGIVVSTVYPFVTATEFHDRLRAGAISTAGRKFEPDTAERVAEAILDLIRTGDEEAVLVPEHLRGSVS